MTERRHYDALIDARGLECPLPLIKARQALMVLDPGATVCVLSTDPGSKADFDRFCETSGHAFLSYEEHEDVFVLVVEKAQP